MRCGDCQSRPYRVVSRPEPTAMLTQNWCEASRCGNGVGRTPKPKAFWRSLVAPWRSAWRCEMEKNTTHLFKNKFPVNYRPSSKKHFKLPGNFKPILGNEPIVSLWRTRLFIQSAHNSGTVPPHGLLWLLLWLWLLLLLFLSSSSSSCHERPKVVRTCCVRKLFRDLNLQKWSKHVVLLPGWLRNVLHTTTVRTFSTSQLLNMFPTRCVFARIFVWGSNFCSLSRRPRPPPPLHFITHNSVTHTHNS